MGRQRTLTAEEVVMNENIREFCTRIGHVGCLASGGKMGPERTLELIRSMYETLSRCAANLGVGGPDA